MLALFRSKGGEANECNRVLNETVGLSVSFIGLISLSIPFPSYPLDFCGYGEV